MKIVEMLTFLFLCLFGPISGAHAQSDAEAEMRELFRSVEKRLKAIDELLSDASTGMGEGLDKIEEAGIDEILKQSRQESQQVIDSIDRILQISEEQSQPSSQGGGSGSPQPQECQPDPQGSPLNRGQQTTPRESTPENPQEQPGSKEPGQEQPGGEQPKPEPQQLTPDPKSGLETQDPNPQNVQLGDAPASAKGSASNAGHVERWGTLPQHAQDVFRSEGGTELPAQYRDWIDAYHRRLNREASRR